MLVEPEVDVLDGQYCFSFVHWVWVFTWKVFLLNTVAGEHLRIQISTLPPQKSDETRKPTGADVFKASP